MAPAKKAPAFGGKKAAPFKKTASKAVAKKTTQKTQKKGY